MTLNRPLSSSARPRQISHEPSAPEMQSNTGPSPYISWYSLAPGTSSFDMAGNCQTVRRNNLIVAPSRSDSSSLRWWLASSPIQVSLWLPLLVDGLTKMQCDMPMIMSTYIVSGRSHSDQQHLLVRISDLRHSSRYLGTRCRSRFRKCCDSSSARRRRLGRMLFEPLPEPPQLHTRGISADQALVS